MTSDGLDDSPPSHAEPVDILLFMFFGLCIGIGTMQLLTRFDKSENVPYTVVLFILGFIIAAASRTNISNAFIDSIQSWIHIDPELILFVFLPPLIFGEAMNLNWHHAKGALLPSLALAGPGVVIGAGLMGVFAKIVLPTSYGWSWLLCLVFGSVLSATDTVAVLSVLKSTGAGTKLTMLIVGESLVNDGTAMVLFDFFRSLIDGEEFSTGEIIGFIIKSIFGSAFFGIITGLLVVRWLRTANNPLKEVDITVQTAVTICCAYLIFFVAQDTFKISGALACTFAGGMVSWLGPPIIISHESMHNVWGFIEWMGNTLIFLLAGLIIGRRTTMAETVISSVDWLYAFIFYLLMILTRLVTVFILLPLLSSKTHKCTWKEGLFISWGGLRGALSMALALIIENSKIDKSESFRIFFYSGMIATLTLLINATASKYILFYLKLIEDNAIEKELVVSQIRKRLSKKMNAVIENLAAELYEDEVEDIRDSLTLLREHRDGGSNLSISKLSSISHQQQEEESHSNDFKFRSPALKGNIKTNLNSNINSNGNSIDDIINGYDEDTQSLFEDGTDSRAISIMDSSESGGRMSSVATSRTYSSLGRRLNSTSHQSRNTSTATVSKNIAGSRYNNMNRVGNVNIDDVNGRGGMPGASNVESPDYEIDNENGSNYIYGGLRARTRSGRQSRFKSVMRNPEKAIISQVNSVNYLLSMNHRGSSPVIVRDLVVYIRCVFLEIVRVRYWHLIQIGRLPRLSHSSQFLLYSIEVGLDEVRTADGLQDWPCIEEYIRGTPFFISVLTYLDSILCRLDITEKFSEFVCKLEAKEEKRIVYLLTSFIEAHEHAQSKIHEFLGLDGGDNASNADLNEMKEQEQIPEELQVISESEQVVARAKALLTCIPDETLRAIKAKQAARTVLYKEESMVKTMVAEGLLTQRHAEEFLEEISEDRAEIETERARAYDEDYAIQRELRNRKFDAAIGRKGGSIRANMSDPELDVRISKPLLDSSED